MSNAYSLSNIILYHFKSYFEKINIPLNFPLTCIIGKNGCGKSALIDSICCCLGSDKKQLRVNKYHELISQSDNYNSDSCSIEIVFEEKTTHKQIRISFYADINGNTVYG